MLTPTRLLCALSCALLWLSASGCEGAMLTTTTHQAEDAALPVEGMGDAGMSQDTGGHEQGDFGPSLERDQGEDLIIDRCESSLEDLFSARVWPTVLATSCIGCHREGGPGALHSTFELDPLGPTEANFATTARLAKTNLLQKSIGEEMHGGEAVLAPEGIAYDTLKHFVKRVQDPDAPCDTDPLDMEQVEPLEVIEMSAEETFQKIARAFGHRQVTQEEQQRLAREGEGALHALIDEVLQEEAFYQRLREAYNDILLTDRGLFDERSHPADYLGRENFPDWGWFDQAEDPTFASAATRYGLVRGPLELIVHVVREGKPFSEILTAEYVMMNAYAARSYGVFAQGVFEDESDPREFRPIELGADPLTGRAYPTAGLLTNTYYLHRYPSTETNRNRHRARMIYQHFLHVDIMETQQQGQPDPTEIIGLTHPVMEASQCAVCHNVMDPVAGAFQKHHYGGRREPTPSQWYTQDMLEPGFEQEVMPEEEKWRALDWLSDRLASDPRFLDAAAAHAYRIVFSRPALLQPTDLEAIDYEASLAAYTRQQELLDEAKRAFSTSGLDFRVLLKHLLLSKDYRAKGLARPPANAAQEEIARSLGAPALATPEQLTRRLRVMLNEPWIFRHQEPLLFDDEFYPRGSFFGLLYGGIDSDSTIKRVEEPNALMGGIIELMANDIGCRHVHRDLRRDLDDRLLLHGVHMTDVPSDPEGAQKIRAAIEVLHQRLFGETATTHSGEIDATYALFVDLQREGAADVTSGAIPKELDRHCKSGGGTVYDEDYVLRAWMGVVSYLFQSYELLYE